MFKFSLKVIIITSLLLIILGIIIGILISKSTINSGKIRSSQIINTPTPTNYIQTLPKIHIELTTPTSKPIKNYSRYITPGEQFYYCLDEHHAEVVAAGHEYEKSTSYSFDCQLQSPCSANCKQSNSYDRQECFSNCIKPIQTDCDNKYNVTSKKAVLNNLLNQYCYLVE